MGNVEIKPGTTVLIEATIVQRTPLAICVMQDDDRERATWLWNRDLVSVTDLPGNTVRVRVDAELAARRGLVERAG